VATGGLVVAAPDLEGMVMRHWWNRNWWWKTDLLGGAFTIVTFLYYYSHTDCLGN